MSNCPACSEPIPAGAESCPRCGITLHQSMSGPSSASGGRSSMLTIVLIIVGGGLVFMLLCGGILAALLLPAVQQSREAARRTQCKNNLKQIGLALHNYHDMYRCFPPAYIADEAGKPLHSWRVLILPFIDQQPLYAQYRFDEPWDGPNNSRLLSSMPPVFRCPSDEGPSSNTTAYAGVFGPNSVFRGAAPVAMIDIKDGTSNTLAVGEVHGAAIPWMQPADIDITVHPAIKDPAGFGSAHIGGTQFLLTDGAVRFVSENILQQTLQSLYTIDGREVVGDF